MDYKEKSVEAFKAISEARAKIDAAEAEGRELTADERAFIDNALEAGVKAKSDADDAERKARVESLSVEFSNSVNRPVVKGMEKKEDILGSEEYKAAFYNFLRTGQKSDLISKAATFYEGDDTAGGAMVPVDFVQEIAAVLFNFAPVLENARVIDVNTNSVDVPQITAHGSSGDVTDEGVAVPDSNPTTARKSITVYKVGASMKATAELVSDAPFFMEQVIAQELGGQVGTKLNTLLTTGTGTGEPKGFVAGATALFTTSATNSVTADELYSVRDKIIAPYWRNSKWYINQGTYLVLSTKKDSNSNYLLGDLASGGGYQLLGQPVVLNPDMAAHGTTGNKFIAFGDLNKGYWALRRPTLSVQRSDDRYFDTDEIAFKLVVRYGADVVDPGAIAVGKHA